MSKGSDSWRLEAELRWPAQAPSERRRERAAERMARSLEHRLAEDVVEVTHDEDHLFIYASSESALHRARTELETRLEADGLTCAPRVEVWQESKRCWRLVEGPPRTHTLNEDVDMTVWWPRHRRQVFLASAVLAAAGIAWYCADPGTLSYNLAWALILPGVVFGLGWAGVHIPTRAKWAVAVPLAPVGPLGYVLLGGAQWWMWGALTPFPLILLIIGRSVAQGTVGASRPWYGGPRDGPWGPP